MRWGGPPALSSLPPALATATGATGQQQGGRRRPAGAPRPPPGPLAVWRSAAMSQARGAAGQGAGGVPAAPPQALGAARRRLACRRQRRRPPAAACKRRLRPALPTRSTRSSRPPRARRVLIAAGRGCRRADAEPALSLPSCRRHLAVAAPPTQRRPLLPGPPALQVVLRTTLGDLDIELWPKQAPKACRNFVQVRCRLPPLRSRAAAAVARRRGAVAGCLQRRPSCPTPAAVH